MEDAALPPLARLCQAGGAPSGAGECDPPQLQTVGGDTDLPAPGSKWMGFRPFLPDSLPVPGRTRNSHPTIYAFGYGHLVLKLAAQTSIWLLGRLVDGVSTDEV
jgi:hypothetical protein